jgi:transposase
MNPRPGPRLMLIMDNVHTHLPEDVMQMCEETEVNLMYLPSYSLDVSPIEESFHLAVKLAVISEDARGYFRSAGISVTEEDQDIDYNEL